MTGCAARSACSAPGHGFAPEAEREADAAATLGGKIVSSAPAPQDPARLRALLPDAPGTPLDTATQREMAARFAHDFSRVRVHDDARAAELAADQRARAYAVGHHVVFGAGRYAPHSPAGRALLTHELGHVVQQSRAGVLALQRDDADRPPPAAVTDPETALGQRLVRDFSSGVALAFYAPMPHDKEEARNAAQKWAKREQALAVKGRRISAANVVFGEPMSDDEHPLTATIGAIGRMLSAAVAKAPPGPEGPLPPGLGPSTVRTLAVFAHGTSTWCGLGSITSSTAASIVKSIAPALGPSINIVLYSCNAGRDPDESEDWVKGTMRPGGGKASLAAVTRDALIAEGKGGSVWGHTTTGHVSENFALREFDVTSGRGSAGSSFVTRYVFTGPDKTTATQELLDAAMAQGYEISPRGTARADAVVENEMYRCYAEANRELDFRGGKLAESAPTHPVEVGRLVRDHWTSTYWPGHRSKAAEILVKELVASGLAKKKPPVSR
ncbi:eCIS core domain-containing protein [Saccharopolyspora rosea]|uniref:DUF4157 domain-containing protein n=1 Tax=Saccharopolyspora rosea TaxID=524884 RepID=A0ABW3FQW9_9PSEU|nr:DUF4157 domain-containing protein [Saccharopolyspora rosea]